LPAPDRRPDLLATPRGRRVLFALLYASEGAPIGYIWWALPTRLRDAGVPIDDVTALGAVLTLPWAFKFLWAPLVDAFRPARGGLRVWITGAQLAMGLTILPIATLDPASDYSLLLGFLLVHAFCAATQDVAIDALAVATIPVRDRGMMTGWMQFGMLIGRAVFGGVALAVEQSLGADVVIYTLVALVWSSSALVWLAREQPAPTRFAGESTRLRRFAKTLAHVLRSPVTWLGLTIAAVAGAAMEATGAVAGPLMIDRGLSPEAVGGFFSVPAVACMAAGALLGGRIADRFHRETFLGVAIVLLAFSVVGVAFAAHGATADAAAPLLFSLGLAYVFFGTYTASAYALFMDLTDPALGGTQFSTYMGAVNLGNVWAAWAVGRLAVRFDYSLALSALAAASLLALPLLAILQRRPAPDWRRADSV
jgi:PAT family beta-lactamase induction signal transducer AmpG